MSKDASRDEQQEGQPIRVIDADIIEEERRKPAPKDNAEAAHRYRLMQAAQIIRDYKRSTAESA